MQTYHDDYVREYAFEPEFMRRRESLVTELSNSISTADDTEKTRVYNTKIKKEIHNLQEQIKHNMASIDEDLDLDDKNISDKGSMVDVFDLKHVDNDNIKEEVQHEVEEFYFMYGRYTKDLGEYAKDEARKLKHLERRRKQEDKARNKELSKQNGRFVRITSWVWRHTIARMGEDWIFLALLGIIMALISYAMDKGITMCTNTRVWLYRDLTAQPAIQYFAWISLPVCLILFSAGFVHLVAPQSIGSGIPEMKTILRGVALKEYLTFKTLVAKIIGLTATLGSGMPLGKEGPFVHIASIVAQLLSKLVTSFQGIYENESRNSEMLAAACAVGVGACFAAPVGGVLFSIEVTTTYFAVRNYWRGFFAAVCGATVFRLLAVWFQKADTVTAMFATNFTSEFPFDPQELFAFALIGVVCGFGGALYVWVHRQYVLFMRSNKRMNQFLQQNRFLYPGILALIISSISFPPGLGQFIAGQLSTHEQVINLFTNFTWGESNLTVEQAAIVNNWTTPFTGVLVNLALYVLFTFFFSIIASTIPVPSGIFIPVFKIGAGLGRLAGELMHLWFPAGVRYGGMITPILPGGYAVVGAAAFAGSVTHTVSVGVIVFEMTGQITHLVPVMIASLISNAIAALLEHSMYDSIILIKKLPYMPDLLPSGSGMYTIYVEDFMVRDMKYIWQGITYQKLKEILKENKGIRSLPLVDSHENMILLGSVQRYELIKLIDKHIGREKRLEMAAKWQKEAQERAREEQERLVRETDENLSGRLQGRRSSRFEVTPAPDILTLRQIANNETLTPQAKKESSTSYLPVFGVQPKKSILKKTNSFTMKGFSPLVPQSPLTTPYTTITGSENRIRSAFDAIFRKSATLQDVTPDPEIGPFDTHPLKRQDSGALTPGISKKVQLPRERVIDMSSEDQKAWEMEEMSKSIDLSNIHIDPAPFQLVERTSLIKVHSLFSMVGINHAYVTKIGRLIGIVGVKELRKAIEDVNSGNLKPPAQLDDDNEYIMKKSMPLTPQEEPLLSHSNEKANSTVTSMDSALSNSENCSDIELDSIQPATKDKVNN